MVEIFWDGFDKYGPANMYTNYSTMGDEWTSVPSGGYGLLVAGRFSNSLALNLTYGYTASRTLPSNYSRLIGGVAMQPSLAGNCGVIFTDVGTDQCSVGFNSSGKLVLWQGGLGGTQIAISSASITANSWHYVEWDLTFASSGTYTVWLDGVQVFTGSGNLKTSSNSYANSLILYGSSSGTGGNFDDMYLFDSTGSTNNAQRGDSRVETLYPTADASVAFSPSQGAIGAYYSLQGLTGYMSANILFLRKFTAPVSGTLNSISIMPQASSSGANFKPAVYADNSGSPGTLLSGGSTVTGCTSGTALTLPLTTAQSLTAGTSYWIGYVTDTSLAMQRQDATGFVTSAGYTASITFSSAPPSTAPSMSSGQYSVQVWGNVTGMSTNYSETNEVPAGGDLSCVTSSTVGAEDRYNFGSLSSTPANIAGVKVSALLRKTDSGARTVTVQLKSGSMEVTGSSQTPTTSYLYFANYQDTDPNTSAAWTASGVNAVSAGAKIAT
ncbi:MAG: hypothetical protein KGI29_05090 [Pseudomonadota bacterium]|nr:hypothetical protein [Pseudomonadota bacterium]MDE3038268.1 hypothetical protein [Pseudomonadota bacterium]